MNWLDYLIIIGYVAGLLYLGYAFRDNRSGKDFFLGGRSFGWFPLALSTAATQLSAVSFISAPAFVGLKPEGGMMWLTYEFAVPLAMLFLMVILVPPMYRAGIVSVYGYLERRFGTSTRVLLSGVFQISRAFATGVMIYTAALILKGVMDIPMAQTILLTGVVTIVYSLQGGMRAVVYGDMVQMLVLLVGIVICLVAGLQLLGGWEAFSDALDRSRLEVLDFQSAGLEGRNDFGFWPMLIGGFFLYVSYYGTDQSQVQRLFSASSMDTVRKTLLTNGLMRFPITLAYCVMGLVIGTFALTNADFGAKIPTDQLDLMLPIFIRDYLPHGLIGLLIVAIFAAAMSSLSSAVNSLSAASVEDFFNRRSQLSPERYLRLSKWFALGWGLICVVLAFFVGDIADTVIEAINKIGSVFYGPMLATFLAAIALPRVNAAGANAGLLVGVAFNVYLWLGVPSVFWFWWNAIGAVVTLVVALLVSSFFTQPSDGERLEFRAEWDVPKAIALVVFFAAIVGVSVWIDALS